MKNRNFGEIRNFREKKTNSSTEIEFWPKMEIVIIVKIFLVEKAKRRNVTRIF